MLGLTQAQFGARYGVNKQRVYKWERGIVSLPSKNIINQMQDDGVVDRDDWFEAADRPLLCGECSRHLDDPVNQGCSQSYCPRHLFATMEEAA